MYLYIDTSKKETYVALFSKDLVLVREETKQGIKNQSENLLIQIESILNKSSLGKKKLRGIFVFSGPGSYTGLRVGVATANALAKTLGIKVLGIKSKPSKNDITSLEKNHNMALPNYTYPPKITKEKPRL